MSRRGMIAIHLTIAVANIITAIIFGLWWLNGPAAGLCFFNAWLAFKEPKPTQPLPFT